MRTVVKRCLMTGYCYGVLPAKFVTWCFKTFELRDA